MANEYIINNYREKKYKDKYLITSDHGSWMFLNKKEYDIFKTGRVKSGTKLYHDLKKKGFLITKDSLNDVIDAMRKRYSFLYHGTSLHIVVPTLRCDLDCVYCHASSHPKDTKGCDMTKNTADKVLDFIFESPSEYISIEFQGGEPLLNFTIVKYMINEAKKRKADKKLQMTIVTNMTHMTEKIMHYLIDNDVVICTSLDGPQKIHDTNRPVKSYEHVKKWITCIQKEYKKRNITDKNIHALLTVTKDSLRYPKEIIDEYVSLGLKSIHLRFLNNLGDARTSWKKISYSAEDFLMFWKKGLDYIIALNKKGIQLREFLTSMIIFKLYNQIDPGYTDLRSPCGAAIGQIVYNYDGSIYPCDEARMVGEDIFMLGNVHNASYTGVLTSPTTCSLIRASTNDSYVCDSCAYKPFCGVCPVCNYVEQGTIIPKVLETAKCKIHMAQFDYIFDKLMKNKQDKKILESWLTMRD